MSTKQRFARNLGAILKALNLSSVDLAASLAVDKSVVRRWLLGSTRPSAVNLTRLSQTVAQRLPGFSVGDWDLAPEGFAARMTRGVDGQTEIARAAGPVFSAFAGFRESIDSEAPVYVGYWMNYVIGLQAAAR